MSMWKRLRQGVDYLSGRYQAFEVTTDGDRAEALALLDEVRRVELNRVHGRSVLESAAFRDVEVDDTLLACRDTHSGRIVACVRGTPASQLVQVPASRDEYALDRFAPELLPRVGIATRLAVQREHRGSAGSLVLLEQLYAEGLKRGYAACVLTCEPGLYAMYLRLGFRPYARVHPSPTGGWRVPMVLPTRDGAHLERIGSPLAKVLQRHGGGDDGDAGVRWFAAQGPVDVGIAAFSEDEPADVHRALTDGVSATGVRQLLEHAHELQCDAGQLVLREGDGGSGIVFVLDGLVEVRRGEQVLSLLGAGEMFGELGTVLGGYRTADVRAASTGTRVLVLSKSALERLTDRADQAQVWRNLARQIARRLVALDRRVAPPAGD